LLETTVKAALLYATGNALTGSVISSQAVALSQGVLQTMFWTKVKIASVLVLMAAFASGAGALGYYHLGKQVDSQPRDEKDKPRVETTKKKEGDSQGKKAIQGNWRVVSAKTTEVDLTDDALEEIKATQWQFTADGSLARIRTKYREKGTEMSIIPATYKLDANKNTIDVVTSSGNKTIRGTFSLDKDILKIEMPNGFLPTASGPGGPGEPIKQVISLIFQRDRGITEYDYPNATDQSETTTDAHVHLSPMNTPDDIEKVRTWYEKKLGIDHDPDLGHIGTRAQVGQGTVSDVANNSTDQHNGVTKQRPVKVYVLLQDSPRHWLQVVLTRADAEKESHIVVTYVTK
jgi:hypothetical protein